MRSSNGFVLVIGATGTQGGAVARELLSRGRDVHALVRAPGAAAAKHLAEAGATLVQGDLDAPETVRSAMSGADAVFAVMTFMTPAGVDGEIRQGRMVAALAQEVDVDHVVYSSVEGAERQSGVPHFESKWAIEQRLRELRVPTTVLRPTYFIDNFAFDPPAVVDGTLLVRLPIRPDVPLPMVATVDVGRFAADAFERPDEHIGKVVALAGDELTGPQVAEAFAEKTRIPAQFEQQPIGEIRAFSDDLALMFEWINEHGYDQTDVDALRRRYRGLQRFRDWLGASDWQPAGKAA